MTSTETNGANAREHAPGDVLGLAQEWLAAGRSVALATVVETCGSSPRPVGSNLVVADDGSFEGSVSGGCVEGAVVSAAQEVIASGQHRLLEFGYSDADAWEVGLACGGQIQVFLERIETKRELIDTLLEARRGSYPAVLVRALQSNRQFVVTPFATNGDVDDIDPALRDAARAALDLDGARSVDVGGERYLIQTFGAAPRIVIIGAVHIAQALIPMAARAGYEICLIDPRTAFANSARFPGIDIDNRWPDEAIPDLELDVRTAVVTLSHDPKIDEPALMAAMDSDAFYIGALGSKGNHAKRRERLAGLGYSNEQLDRINGPIGLPLGGRSPAEIAVAILAQVIQSKHQNPATRQAAAG